MENNMEVPEKTSNRILMWSRNPTSRYAGKRIRNKFLNRYLHIHIHYSIFSIAKRWISMRDRKMCHIHTMKHYSPLKMRRLGFSGGSIVKNQPTDAGDMGSFLILEDPTCCGATKPMCHNYWAQALEPRSRNFWRPCTLEPVLLNKRSQRNEKPAHHN